MNTLLEDFKLRMHIFHSSEDKNLSDILDEAQSYINDKTGLTADDPRAKRLILERGRYNYNDSLEFFEDNFLSELIGLSLTTLKGDDNSGEET
ncbi:MAG: phage head-tail connector protein [Leuconostoc sp.]|nr:phage head-tail connector protein [Leuconostoc sp.]